MQVFLKNDIIFSGQFEGQDESGSVNFIRNDSLQSIDASAIEKIVLLTNDFYLGTFYMSKTNKEFVIPLKNGSQVNGKIVKKYPKGIIKVITSSGLVNID